MNYSLKGMEVAFLAPFPMFSISISQDQLLYPKQSPMCGGIFIVK